MFGLVPVLNPYIKEGRLRPIAMTGKKRNPLLPDVPTIADTLPGYDVESWEGIVAPAATPRPLIARLNKDIAAAVNSQELRELWKNRGVETVTSTPEELSAKLRDEYIRYGELLKKTGVSK
jgi:tripartite-type tricarboxylate transporter receptor subunit TctC